MLSYALKLSLESEVESISEKEGNVLKDAKKQKNRELEERKRKAIEALIDKDTTTEEKDTKKKKKKDEEKTTTLPFLTRTQSTVPPQPSNSTSYSMKKTISEVKDNGDAEELEPSSKVFSFYRSQSTAHPKDDASSNTSVFVWGFNDPIMLPLLPSQSIDQHHDLHTPRLVNSMSTLKIIDIALRHDHLLGRTHEGSVVGMGNNDEGQVMNEDIDIIKSPRTVDVATESGAHHISCGM